MRTYKFTATYSFVYENNEHDDSEISEGHMQAIRDETLELLKQATMEHVAHDTAAMVEKTFKLERLKIKPQK